MESINYNSHWLIPCGNQGRSLIIRGWYPAQFDWDIKTLHSRQAQLKRVKIIYGVRLGENGGSVPPIHVELLPVPLFSDDRDVTETFAPYWDGFVTVPVQAGLIRGNNFDKWPNKSLVLVPLLEVFYESPDDVPVGRHLAVIANKFCFSAELVRRIHSYYFRTLVLAPFSENVVFPTPTTLDYSAVFAKREKTQVPVIEERITKFILAGLQRYQLQYSEPLGGILLDCDPKYGYIILALKQTPIVNPKHIEIDNFELDRFAMLEAAELYEESAYLSATQFRTVLKRVILALAQHDFVRGLACPELLHIAYAFHDEDLHWVAEVAPDHAGDQ